MIELCRVIKFPHEIELIRRANDISAKAHRAVLENIRKFKNERQVEGIFLDTCISSGAHNQAYNIIAGAGTNAAVLHYIANNAPFGDSQVLLLDAGAEFDCYASDVTRTFPISGHWSPEAKNIYDAVNDMQSQCVARIKPGVHFRDLQILAMAIATRWLLELGILHNGSVEEIMRAGTTRAFFPHGLGHHVGLEVHDVLHIPIQSKSTVNASDVEMSIYHETELHGASADAIVDLYSKFIDSETCMNPVTIDSPVLESGMIVTVEPGIYFSDFALSKVYLRDPQHLKYINKEVLTKYMPVGGVRIEDDILVTKAGYQNLTTAPKGDEALHIIRGDAFPPIPSSTKGKAKADPCAEMKSPQLSEDLAAKCSMQVKQEKTDCLPPRDEINSLIGSFPFSGTTPVAPTYQSLAKGLLGEIMVQQHNLLQLCQELANKHPDFWSQLRSGSTDDSKSYKATHAWLQHKAVGVVNTLRQCNFGADHGRIRSTVPIKLVSIQSPKSNSSTSFPDTVDVDSQSSRATEAAQEWPGSLALSASQELVLDALRSRPRGSQPVPLEKITIDADLEPAHTSDILAHLCTRGLVRRTIAGDKFMAVRRSSYERAMARPQVLKATPSNNAAVTPTEAPPIHEHLVRALYDFDKPDDEATISFKKGDLIWVIDRRPNGWSRGIRRCTGQSGWLPENHVERLPATEAGELAEPASSATGVVDANAQSSTDGEETQIQQAVATERLRTVFTNKLTSLLDVDSEASKYLKASILQDLIQTEDESAVVCFSGLCMQLQAMHGAINFGRLPGSGIDKFAKLFEEIDKALELEFSHGHLFHRLGDNERIELARRKWVVVGVMEESASRSGICGYCRICRQGFALWDENWLASGDEEDNE